MSEFIYIENGICAPKGFLSSAVSCGIKESKSERLDLGLIYSKFPTLGAALYTENQIKAAPVSISSSYIKSTEPRALIVNSGNANACTGHQGMVDARSIVTDVSKALGLRRREVQICSTGIIGVPLPMDRITPNIPTLVKGLNSNGNPIAQAILTSDTKEKSIAIKFKIDDKKVKIGAIAKGAGMINPSMATMLCFVTTDAVITKAELVSATKGAVDKSFNRISIDGDTSTNDTVLVMANGQAKNKAITYKGKHSDVFRKALNEVMLSLAKKIVSDGERVTKLVEIDVRGASSIMDAERVSRAIGNSQLVKSSWNGNDPNWGRIMHAIGYSGARIKEELIDIYFGGSIAVKNGVSAKTSINKLCREVEEREFTIGVDLNIGKGSYSFITSDISPEYVEFNRKEYSIKKP